jgi:hypothetical protein
MQARNEQEVGEGYDTENSDPNQSQMSTVSVR